MKFVPTTVVRYIASAAFMLLSFFFLASTAFAQEAYQPLTSIPGVDPANLSLSSYVNALFLLSIALGAMLAVIKIVIAGFKYMFTDAVPTKSDAKSDIYGALLGLGILLATFVVLYTINPQLTNLDILTGAESVKLVEPVAPNNSTQNGTEQCEGKNCIGYDEAFKERCRQSGGNPTPVQPFAAMHICKYSEQTCAENENFVLSAGGQGACQPRKESPEEGNGNAQLCPQGQKDIQFIEVGGDGIPNESDGAHPYPDGVGYYTCAPV